MSEPHVKNSVNAPPPSVTIDRGVKTFPANFATWKPICGCAFAASFTWAVEDLLYIPSLMAMGAPEQLCSWIFLSNAVLGLLITPYLASWSDRISRRQPFILGGALCACSSLVGMSMVFILGTSSQPTSVSMVMLVFALAGGVEFGVDLMLTAGRSLLCDHTEHDEAEMGKGNAAYGLSINLGRLIGMIAISASPVQPSKTTFLLWAAAVVGSAAAMTILLAPDVKFKSSKAAAVIETSEEHRKHSLSMIGWLLLAQCTICWVAILTTGMYFSTLVSSCHSDSSLAPLAMAAQSFVAIVSSTVLPKINGIWGSVPVNNCALLGYSVALVALGISADSAVFMVVLMGVTGITCAVIDCNPFIICEQFTDGEDRGRAIAMLDNTMNAAQVLCAVGLGQVVHLVGDIKLVFCAVGVGSGVAMLATTVLLERERRLVFDQKRE